MATVARGSIGQLKASRNLRKRAPVNYCEESDGEQSEGEVYAPIVKKSRTRTTKAPATREHFPFLSLPAELRNMIYDLAFPVPEDVSLEYMTHLRRRCARASNFAPGHTGLLRVNRQIFAEAAPLLYRANFVFDDMKAMFQFLVNIGPCKSQFIQRIIIQDLRSTSDLNCHAAFTLLRGLPNLRDLVLSYPYISTESSLYRSPSALATRFYSIAAHWMEEVARKSGRYDAAVDIIDISRHVKRASVSRLMTDEEHSQCLSGFTQTLRGHLHNHR
ncbi:hypothetical protein NA57DRAFT_74609 [Rhizodiscina lignyota]|uniref:2EXR domain-containing protein n=1 Tax=Rhizodiscina lignyota TaxID=1504668 RepID=A0A9P4IFX7_9PEZI|nr:hypothetical protein NA57DRAFT_74609 [Rhizodiscina lignyota]